MTVTVSPTPALGRLQQVDLRTAWISEAGGFTPWLAQEENLALLGETVGIDLELEAQEHNVGPFRADILCKDTATNHWVLIENQLERTDHIHLGQLLTYAAGLDAVTIVWIAAKFTDEHRAALDWLNEKTEESVNFFGLEIELWRIAGSPPAPKFNVVSQPNDWARSVAEGASGISATGQLQLEYWQALCGYLEQRRSPLKPGKPYPQSWLDFDLGRPNCKLTPNFLVSKRELAVAVVLRGPRRRAYFRLLSEQKADIDAAVGMDLVWDERPEKTESQIWIPRKKADPSDRSDWPNQHEWFRTTLETFQRVFGPRLKELRTDESMMQEDAHDTAATTEVP